MQGAWWYGACNLSNLNGVYYVGGTHATYGVGIDWSTYRGYYQGMAKAVIMVR